MALARSKAAAKRKSTLLVEWQASQKANAFQDRRLGEKEEGLSKEDKMFARFKRQQTRNVKRKRSGKFALHEDAEEDELTHGGRKLNDMNFEEDKMDAFSDEDDDGFTGAWLCHFRDLVCGVGDDTAPLQANWTASTLARLTLVAGLVASRGHARKS